MLSSLLPPPETHTPAMPAKTRGRANGISYAVYLKMHQENDVWKVSSFNRI